MYLLKEIGKGIFDMKTDVKDLGRTGLIVTVLFCMAWLSAMTRVQDEGVWVQCMGEAVIRNITAEEAHRLALENARQNAVEKGCGISLQSETWVNNFAMAGDFVRAISHGRVVEEKDLKWETASIPSDMPGRPPSLVVRVVMNARVVSESGVADPDFKISVEMNKREFRSGDEAVFNVSSTRDCYVTVLSLAANDSVYVLFPNAMQKNNGLKAGESIRIPDGGFKIRVMTLPGHTKDSEVVQVIATKQAVTIYDPADIAFGKGSVGTPRVAITKLARILAGISVSDRAEDSKIYTVSSK